MIKRPRPGEDEEDILQMQEEFLREKSKNEAIQPAAQVVNLRSYQVDVSSQSSSTERLARKPSKYARANGLQKQSEERARLGQTSALVGNIFEKNTGNKAPPPNDDNVYFPTVLPFIIGDIVEKNIDNSAELSLPPMPTEGFPIVPKRDTCKKNIYKQHTTSSMEVDEQSTSSNIPNTSHVLTTVLTATDATAIHQANVETLQNMSEKEILEEKQKLLLNLDPKIITFLRKQRHKDGASLTSQNLHDTSAKNEMSYETCIEISDNIQSSDTLWENDVLSHPEVGQWMHFDQLEKDKLEWIKSIKNSKIIRKADEPYEARFDFKGYLLPYIIEYNEQTKTLFHHGDDPHRPGYSFTELFELSRSSVTQQRVMALNTLAGILEYWSIGTYKDIIQVPLSKILFIIRFAVDENKVILLEPALKALRNLIYNRIDEASLDALIGFEQGLQQPCLENDKSEINYLDSDESELKDFHLAELDIITALLRTDILQRIYYILNTIRPSFNCVQYTLQILTRLARDSVDTALKIINSEHLTFIIVNNFIPMSSVNFSFQPDIVYNGKPILAALKLLRVLTLQSKEINEVLVSKYNILNSVSEYVSSGVDGTYGLRIQIEAFCVLTNVLQFGIGVDHAMSLLPVVVTALFKHVQGTDIVITSSLLSATHGAVVLQFLSELLKNSRNIEMRGRKQQIYPLLEDGMRKWLTQLSKSKKYSCAHFRLASSALDCWKTVMFLERLSPKLLNDLLNQLSISSSFKIIANEMQTCSNLLSKIEAKDLHRTKNLASLGSSVIDNSQRVLPILSTTSPFPFLSSLLKLLILLNDNVLNNRFMNQFTPYLKKLDKTTPSLCDNWFTRVEIEFLVNTVKLSLQMELSESDKDQLYTISNKLCYILRADKRYELEFLFENIVFNQYWFTAERLMNLVSISDEGVSKILNSIEEIKYCFCRLLQINYVDNGPNVMLRMWQEPVLPRDWIYLPIVHLYSLSQELDATPKVEGEHANRVTAAIAAEKELIVRCNLVWILFNEICFPELLRDISVTERFCRIMCVYICDSSIFLDTNVNVLLQKILKLLFRKKDSFNFDNKLAGLNNFQDLYTQFIEQFQAVSYGEATFAACVLVPLAQRHNPQWRKLLWSEYAGALRALDCPADMLCGDMSEYLQPPETDVSLLKSYARALSSGLLRPQTIAHQIASHHVYEYKRRIGK